MTAAELTPSGTRARRLDLGRVVKRTFSLVGRNWMTFVPLAAVLAALPQLGWSLAARQFGLTYRQGNGSPGQQWYWITLLVSAVGAVLAQGAIIPGAMASLADERPSFGRCVASSLRTFGPVFLVTILAVLGILFSSIFFVIPGVLLALTWVVAAPAVIVERTDVWKAFGRSADLTHGSKWAILALAVAYYLLDLLLSLLAAGIDRTLLSQGGRLWSVVAASMVAAADVTLLTTLWCAGLASLYVELRSGREGPGHSGLAAVFD